MKQLAVEVDTLDVNSTYTYLLLCQHFAETCLLVEKKNELVGFVSSYFPPQLEETLFVWQIAVKNAFRGKGIGKSLLTHLLENVSGRNLRFLETTITPSNKSSRSLFLRLAKELDCPVEETELFHQVLFSESTHESEFLIRIGPF